MIALGQLIALLAPYIPAAISLVTGLVTAWWGAPKVVTSHPVVTSAALGVIGAGFAILPSPFKTKPPISTRPAESKRKR
jgi:hypothetical protein